MNAGRAEVRAVIERAQHRAPDERRAHDLLPRRDPSLQQGAAGHAAAGGRGRHRRAGGRHHREPLLRGELGAAVALPDLRAALARGRARARAAAARARATSAASPDAPRVDDDALEFLAARSAGDARTALSALELAGRDRGRGRRGDAARGRGRPPAQRDPLRQGRRPPLRPDLGLDQVHARLRSGRLAPLPGGDDRGRRGPALHRPADGRAGERGHRQRRPARARGGRERRARGGARGHARVRAEPGPGGGVPGAGAEVERLVRGHQAGARVGARARHARAARGAAQRRLPGREEARPRARLRLPALPPGGRVRAGADAGGRGRRALPRALRARRGGASCASGSSGSGALAAATDRIPAMEAALRPAEATELESFSPLDGAAPRRRADDHARRRSRRSSTTWRACSRSGRSSRSRTARATCAARRRRSSTSSTSSPSCSRASRASRCNESYVDGAAADDRLAPLAGRRGAGDPRRRAHPAADLHQAEARPLHLRAARRGGRDRALELPVVDPVRRGGDRADGRQRRGAEAGVAHAADRPAHPGGVRARRRCPRASCAPCTAAARSARRWSSRARRRSSSPARSRSGAAWAWSAPSG